MLITEIKFPISFSTTNYVVVIQDVIKESSSNVSPIGIVYTKDTKTYSSVTIKTSIALGAFAYVALGF